MQSPLLCAAAENSEKLIRLGWDHVHKGEIHQAQMAFALAVAAVPDNKAYKAYFLHSVTGHGVGQFHENLKQAISLCLAEPDLMHLPMFFAWYSTLMLEPAHRPLRDLLAFKDYESFSAKFSWAECGAILNSEFLRQGLQKLLMKNYGFETLLTNIRRYMLLAAGEEVRRDAAPFMSTLSAQCFFNEYIFYVSEAEQKELQKLRVSEDAADKILLTCYESAEEEPLKAQIKTFGSIKDQVSQAVQAQYEENPYPRWVSCGGIVRSDEEKSQSAGKKILVAGCGTGQQACMVSLRFPAAEITAIDLSAASLAYGMRKAEEMKLGNIEFLQGDILEVKTLNKAFDYIACGGVLHHMASPQEGLAALKDVLAPEGVMRLALYSEIARKDIVAVQKFAAEKGTQATPEGMRNFRYEFINGEYKKIFGETLPFFDAFSMSECRDLFFHAQEHRFTCLGLRDLLARLELDTLIFAADAPSIQAQYTTRFPEDRPALNLENWHHFEQDNPGAFINMYKFYVGHKGRLQAGQIPAWLR